MEKTTAKICLSAYQLQNGVGGYESCIANPIKGREIMKTFTLLIPIFLLNLPAFAWAQSASRYDAPAPSVQPAAPPYYAPAATTLSPAAAPQVLPQAQCECYRSLAPAFSPQTVYQPVITYRPVLPLAAMPSRYYVGRGVLGQPKLYVPSQPIRNFLRYLSP